VAGDADAIVWLNEVLTLAEIFCRVLLVDVPYHSPRMDPLATEFASSLRSLAPAAPVMPAYSSVTGEAITSHQQDATYWWRNARQPVLFADALATMIGDGFNTFVEIGPHPVLVSAIDACLLRAGVEGESISLQQRHQPELDTLLGAIAQLYTSGADINWSEQYPSGTLISLPSYPWDRERLWSETEASRADRLGTRGHPLLTPRLDEPLPTWEGELSGSVHRYLLDHQVEDEAVLPAAAFVEMALLAVGATGEPVVIEDLILHRPLAMDETPFVRLLVDGAGAGLRVFSRPRDTTARWVLNASAKLLAAPAPARAQPL
jgi:acyl transferase domain-containing protein